MRLVLVLALCAPSLFFARLYYDMHWKHRACFNDEGRCFDASSGVIYVEQGGAIYLGLAVLGLIGPILGVWLLRRAPQK